MLPGISVSDRINSPFGDEKSHAHREATATFPYRAERTASGWFFAFFRTPSGIDPVWTDGIIESLWVAVEPLGRSICGDARGPARRYVPCTRPHP